MKRSLLLVISLLSAILVISQSGSHRSLAATEEAPYYERQVGISECTFVPSGAFTTVPCFRRDAADDAQSMYLGECTTSISNFCYTATVDDQPVPTGLQFVVMVGAYKTHTSSESIAGYEAYVNAFYVEPGAVLNGDMFGSSDRPADQAPGRGKVDLSPVLTADKKIKIVLKYKTVGIPQYSVIVADEGNMTFALTGQDLTLTIEGKPARVAVESPSEHILGPTDTADPTANWTDKCGIPSMKFVVCNVEKASSDGLSFYARSKSFVFAPANASPAPIWVSTNATYFHFPGLEIVGKLKQISVKTAAPHFLADGITVNSGNFAAFLPNGLLKQWGIEKSDAALKAALAASVTKGTEETEVPAEFLIKDDGVKIKFPKMTYSAPVAVVKQKPEAVVTTTTVAAAIDTTTSTIVTTTVPSTVPATFPVTTSPSASTKTVKRGKSITLTSLLKPIGSGKQTWTVTGGCTVKGRNLVAPKKSANCQVTLKQAKLGKQKASTRRITVKVI